MQRMLAQIHRLDAQASLLRGEVMTWRKVDLQMPEKPQLVAPQLQVSSASSVLMKLASYILAPNLTDSQLCIKSTV